MAHPRTEARNAIKQRLLGLPTTGQNVFIGRTRALKDSHPPTLLIYTPSDQTERGNPTLLEFIIEGRVSMAIPPDDELDVIDEEVMAQMRDAEDDVGLFDIMRLNTEINTSADGQRHLGSIKMRFAARYFEPSEPD